MPEGLDPQFWDAQSGVKMDELLASYKSLSEFRDSIGTPPEDVSEYSLDLPEDFDVPAGLELKYDANDEFTVQAREMAKELGLSKEGFSKLLAFDAQRQIAEYQKVLDDDKAEKEKLGAQAEARIGAVENWLKANLDQELYEAFRPAVYTAKAIQAVETLMKKANASGIPSEDNPNPPNPAPPPQRTADIFYGNESDKKAG